MERQMLVGYARTSTLEQKAGFEVQLKELQDLGCEKIFQEQVSSVAERAELERALDFIREGDILVVAKLDRLARSMRDLMQIVDAIKRKGAALRIVNLVDTTSPTGELILNVLGSIAQFERQIMLERQREGIAKAKSEGLYKGRQRTAQQHKETILKLHGQGMGVAAILREIRGTQDKKGRAHKIGQSSVYAILAEQRGQANGG
jgi:DNA invertase Pin-like site-specific DNA recombinase